MVHGSVGEAALRTFTAILEALINHYPTRALRFFGICKSSAGHFPRGFSFLFFFQLEAKGARKTSPWLGKARSQQTFNSLLPFKRFLNPSEWRVGGSGVATV